MKNTTLIFLAATLALLVLGCDKEQDKPITYDSVQAQRLMNYENEANTLRSILKEDPENLNALIKLGNIYMDTGRFAEAAESYGKAIEIDPSNVNVRVDMGTCYRRIGRSDRAVEEYRKAISISPRHPNAHMNLGVVLLYDFGKQKEAVQEFEKFLEIAPNSQQAPTIRQEVQRVKAAMAATSQKGP